MRKDLLLPGAAIILGVAGFFTRRWQLESAFDTATQLHIPGSIATYALIGLSLLVAVILVVFSGDTLRKNTYQSAFYGPSTLYIMLAVLSGLLFFGAAGMSARQAMTEYYLWKAQPMYYLFPFSLLLLSAACIPAGVVTLVLGKGNFRGSVNPKQLPVLVTLPAFTALIYLVRVYQLNGIDPIYQRFMWIVLGAVCTVLGLYYTVCFAYGRARPRMALFFTMMGVYLNLVILADPVMYATKAVAGAFLLLLLANGYAMARNLFGPVWPRRLQRTSERMPRWGEEDEVPQAQPDTPPQPPRAQPQPE